MPRDCPRCSRPIDGLSCGYCGWRDAAAPAVPVDRTRWLCADERDGLRCGKLGVYSHSTQGSDRWYCADHFSVLAGGKVDPHALQHLREAVKRASQPRPVVKVLEEEQECPF